MYFFAFISRKHNNMIIIRNKNNMGNNPKRLILSPVVVQWLRINCYLISHFVINICITSECSPLFSGTQNKILPYVVFGTVSITAAAVSMLLPDTRNSKLPDLISEAKAIRGYVPEKYLTKHLHYLNDHSASSNNYNI